MVTQRNGPFTGVQRFQGNYSTLPRLPGGSNSVGVQGNSISGLSRGGGVHNNAGLGGKGLGKGKGVPLKRHR